MSFSFEYLATGSGKALILIFDNHKYLFSCFEGFQRYSIESKIKLSQLTTVILPTKYSIIPFIGTYLTIGDMGKDKLNILTSKENFEIFNFTKCFAYRPNLKINKFSQNYEDKMVKIKIIENGDYNNVILHIKPLRGKFNKKKAEECNIPKNLWKVLCNKEKIKYKNSFYDGCDFLEDDQCFEKIAIIFSDNINDIQSYNDIKMFICFQEKVAVDIKSKTVASFFILNDSSSIDFLSLFELQRDLNKIYDAFHVSKCTLKENLNNNCKNFHYLNSRDIIYWSKEIFDYKVEPYLNTVEYFNEKSKSKDGVIFLGTGSAIPSKYRNVSSILIERKNQFILLDCGEDTYYNILRFYGDDHIIKDIETIFISHSHADHHLGLVKVLTKVLENRESINLICPEIVYEFVQKYVQKGINHYSTNSLNRNLSDFELLTYTFMTLDFQYKVQICPVNHFEDSSAIRIDFENFSCSYSGDCRPSLLFAKLSANIDLMIHEATFEDNLQSKAHKTKHSTVSEAINIFERSNAKRLILTHFSQRYPRIMNHNNVICALDFFKYEFLKFDEYKYNKCQEYLLNKEKL